MFDFLIVWLRTLKKFKTKMKSSSKKTLLQIWDEKMLDWPSESYIMTITRNVRKYISRKEKSQCH